jgi:NADH-quinone oxidoreductase subunit N
MVLTPPLEDAVDTVDTVDTVDAAGASAATGRASDEPADGDAAGGGARTLTAARRAVTQVGVVVVASRGPAAVAIALCVLGVVALGVVPGPVLDWMTQAADFRP